MGLCTKRRIYVLFLTVTILQIITSGVRQIFDFLGPLWSMIFSNFLTIVFAIFGFFGGYTRRKHYLISYIVWSVAWSGWNVLIILLYIPVPELEIYKSSILSLGTGGISWWWTRAPGCVPDWGSSESPTQIVVTNCLLNPRVVEVVQGGVQVWLALTGIFTAISIIVYPPVSPSDKESRNGEPNKSVAPPSFFTLGRSGTRATGSLSSRPGSRIHHSNVNRAPLGIPSSTAEAGTSSAFTDDRLRPMTPRKVKRRSARSIQSQRFGPSHSNHSQANSNDRESQPSTRVNSASSSARNSLRSNASRRSMNHRNSKRKTNHFVSPINRLMQQVDSETSHDERYPLRDQGHVNPVYLGPQGQLPPAPPRPPSARSSYSNYHPARIPINSPMASNVNPNVFNLNQNIFTNPAFDNSPEYNESQHSNNTSNTLYEDEINFHPSQQQHLHSSPILPNHISPHSHNQMMAMASVSPNIRSNPNSYPNGYAFNSNHLMKNGAANHSTPDGPHPSADPYTKKTDNPAFVYPLAHSPISQDSYPMWGVAPAQVPSPNNFHPPYRHPPNPTRPFANSRQPINSETVI